MTTINPLTNKGNTVNPTSPYQRRIMTELYQDIHDPIAYEDAVIGLERMFVKRFGHGVDEATYNETASVIGELLFRLRGETNDHD